MGDEQRDAKRIAKTVKKPEKRNRIRPARDSHGNTISGNRHP
jgi:hypothetical protein